jgi:F-type H+-transporting ATPase subunit alpha
MAEKNDDKFIALIRERIAKYSSSVNYHEEGRVLFVSDGIAFVSGLSNVMLNEIVEFENGTKGIALNLEMNTVGIIILGEYLDIKENSLVTRTKTVVSTPVGDELLGRVVNPLGRPIDSGPPFPDTIKTAPIEKQAPGVMKRKPVNQPLLTGILMIDAMFPIGKGQRELIIGDRQTGKTSIGINAILNQKGKNVKCVYVSIGQKNSTLAQVIRTLETNGALEYTTVVASTASDLPSLLYLTPFTGITIAEE